MRPNASLSKTKIENHGVHDRRGDYHQLYLLLHSRRFPKNDAEASVRGRNLSSRLRRSESYGTS